MTTATRNPDPALLAWAIEPEELNRLLGLPRHRELGGELAERAAWAREWYAEHGTPWVRVRRYAIGWLGDDSVLLEDGRRLVGRGLADLVRRSDAHALAAIAASAGAELDEASAVHWREGRPDEAYFLERLGAAIVERLLLAATLDSCQVAETGGETLTPHLSPGCGSWELSQQHALWPLLFDHGEPAPISLLESGGLTPKNAILAVAGITRRAVMVSPSDACRSCSLARCAFRRARSGGWL